MSEININARISSNSTTTSCDHKALVQNKPVCLKRLDLTKSQEAIFAVCHFSQKNYSTITKSNLKIAKEACLFLINSKEKISVKTVSRAVKKFSSLNIMENEVDTRFMNTAERYLLPGKFTEEEKVELDYYFGKLRKLAKREKKRYLSYFGNVPQYSVLTVDFNYKSLGCACAHASEEPVKNLKTTYKRKYRDDSEAINILRVWRLTSRAKDSLLRFPNKILHRVARELSKSRNIAEIYALCRRYCFEEGIIPDHLFSRALEATSSFTVAFKPRIEIYLDEYYKIPKKSKIPQREMLSHSLCREPVEENYLHTFVSDTVVNEKEIIGSLQSDRLRAWAEMAAAN